MSYGSDSFGSAYKHYKISKSNLVSKDSLNMMDNIPAMKILHCRPFLEHDQAVNATRLIVCLKVSCSWPVVKYQKQNLAPTKYASNKVGFDFKGVIFQALGYNVYGQKI